MSLTDFWERIKLKARFKGTDEDIHFDEGGEVVQFPLIRKIFLALLIILVGTLGFGLGKLSSLNQNNSIKIEYSDLDNNQSSTSNTQSNLNNQLPNNSLKTENSKIENSAADAVTVSSKGTRYYYSWCKNTISDKNKISFASAILAEKAGYTLATNCTPR